MPPRCSQVCWKPEQYALPKMIEVSRKRNGCLMPAVAEERGAGARLGEQARVRAEGEAAGRRRPEAGFVGNGHVQLVVFFGQRRGGGRVQRLAAEHEHVGALFDHLLSGHHGLLGFRASVGVDDPDLVAVDAPLGVGFRRSAVRPRRRWRHRAPCSRSWPARRRSRFLSAGPWTGAAGGVAAAAATGEQDQGKGESKRGEKLRQNA